MASGVNTAHQSSHTCPSDIFHRNAVLFQPLNDADMSQPERPATLENQADVWTLCCGSSGRVLCNRTRRCQDYREGKQYSRSPLHSKHLPFRNSPLIGLSRTMVQ